MKTFKGLANFKRVIRLHLGLLLGAVVLFSSCNKNVINKTTYEGKKVKNTCETFSADVKAVEESNSDPAALMIAQYDNADFGPAFLEPGQFVIKGDTLYFRLVNDFPYEKYLRKRVAIYVNPSFSAPEHLQGMEETPSGTLPTIVVTEDYYKANKDMFVYKVPVTEAINGKQLTLSFSVVKFNKKGQVKKVYCNTVDAPVGAITPSCCTYLPWEPVRPKTVVQAPELKVGKAMYRYKNFTGTLDLIFPMNSIEFDRTKVHEAIFDYLKKYENEGYKLSSAELKGYASQGGTVDYNQDLSQRRADAVAEELKQKLIEAGYDSTGFNISGMGLGEDWERFEMLVNTGAFTEEEKNQIFEIVRSPIHPDEKEAQLRKLDGLWNGEKGKLVDEVLVYCRHTFIKFNMESTSSAAYGSYSKLLPIFSPELYKVALQENEIGPYTEGANISESLTIIGNLISAKPKEANLYALRSTYYFAQNDIEKALADIEKALRLDPNNTNYKLASLIYKTMLADKYSMEERTAMLNAYNDYIAQYPNNKLLHYNKIILMEKIGFLSGAIREYTQAIESNGDNAALYNNRGVAYLKTNRFEQAEADFRKAISLDSKLAEPHFNLAIIYAYRGWPKKAAMELKEAKTKNPAFESQIWSNPAFQIVKDMPAFAKTLKQ